MRGVCSPQASLRRITWTLTGLLLMTLLPGNVQAIEFDLLSGRVTGQFDTTASMGFSWRVSSRDESIIGTVNGGTAFSLNGDDGNLNYDKGDFFSKNFKILHEISVDYDDYEFFVRGFYFRDFAIREGDILQEGRPAITGTTERFAGKNAVLLDAWVRREFDFGDKPVQLTRRNYATIMFQEIEKFRCSHGLLNRVQCDDRSRPILTKTKVKDNVSIAIFQYRIRQFDKQK